VRQKGFPVFYPRLRVRPVNPRARKVLPYFPGYMFVQADIATTGLGLFQWMPNALGLVCFGQEAAAVPEPLIAGLRKRLEEASETEAKFLFGLRPGDRLWIKSGPLAGYEAVFDSRLPGRDRVRVLLSLLQDRRIPVELSAELLDRTTRG
jgi:transcriptional antiterminator RfaH